MVNIISGIRSKVKSILAQWEPAVVEESLSFIGWPKTSSSEETDQQVCLHHYDNKYFVFY